MQSDSEMEIPTPKVQVKKPEFISDLNYQRMCFAYWIINYRLNDDTNTWQDLEKFEKNVGLRSSSQEIEKIMGEYEKVCMYVNNFVGSILYQNEGQDVKYEKPSVTFIDGIKNTKWQVEYSTGGEIDKKLENISQPKKTTTRKPRAKPQETTSTTENVSEETTIEAQPKTKSPRKPRAKKEETTPSITPAVATNELTEELPVEVEKKTTTRKPRAKKAVIEQIPEDMSTTIQELAEKKTATRKPRAKKEAIVEEA